MIEASFVIIAFNEQERVERALQSISAQQMTGDYEIVVVDDCSSDATAAIAERYREIDPATRVVRHETNLGRGAARASGVRAAAGRYVAMVDADIELPPDWYARCVAALDSCDAVSGIPIPDGDAMFIYRTFGFEPKPTHSTKSITGNNALFRSEVFERVSFEGSLRNGEDIALSHALEQAGLRAATIDDLTVRHEEGKGFWKSLSWMFESGQGAHRQLLRYRVIRAPDLAFLAWFASIAAAARVRRFRAAALPMTVSAAVSAAHLQRKFRLDGEPPSRVLAAIGAGTLMMSAYLGGRLAAPLTTVVGGGLRAARSSGDRGAGRT
jgi:glycosyltransferase involved in cell wall biosynthesis